MLGVWHLGVPLALALGIGVAVPGHLHARQLPLGGLLLLHDVLGYHAVGLAHAPSPHVLLLRERIGKIEVCNSYGNRCFNIKSTVTSIKNALKIYLYPCPTANFFFLPVNLKEKNACLPEKKKILYN